MDSNFKPTDQNSSPVAHETHTIQVDEIIQSESASGAPVASVQVTATLPIGTSLTIRIAAVQGAQGISIAHQIERSRNAVTAGSSFRTAFHRLGDFARTTALRTSVKSSAPFVTALVVYLCCMLIGVVQYPIFFFTDEAVHTNFAAALWQNGLRGPQGDLLPTYFQIDPTFGLNGTSVYVHLLPTILFGQSVVVTRSTAALVTLLAAICASLLLRDGLRIRNWWLGALVLCASPIWFLHARTAFEYMLVASFYTATLYFYQRYRNGCNRCLFAALAAAALTFYSHGLGQVLIALTALVFGILDFRHHIDPQQRRTMLLAFTFALLLALPWVRFQLAYDDVVMAQIRQRGSYWTSDSLSLIDKLRQWASEYFYGISPQFWFLPNDRDLSRHTIPGTGSLLLVTAPFALLGLITCLQRIRDTAHRNVLAALFIAPIPATIVAIGTPRLIWMMVLWSILIVIGFERVVELVRRLAPRIAPVLPAAAYIGLAASATTLLIRALTVGQTWHSDYSLYGQQYGAQQVFGDLVAPTLARNPNAKFVVSPSWANGTDQFLPFFIPRADLSRVNIGLPINWIERRSEVTPNTYFITTRPEFESLASEPIFSDIQVRQVISYPDGTAGFLVFSLAFAPDADERIAAMHVARRTPIRSTFAFRGASTPIVLSPLGEGVPENLFDGNPESLVRGLEANPLLFDITLPEPLDLQTVDVRTGSMVDFSVQPRVYPIGQTEPISISQRFTDQPPDPQVTLRLPEKITAGRFVLEVTDHAAGNTAQIHVREVTLR